MCLWICLCLWSLKQFHFVRWDCLKWEKRRIFSGFYFNWLTSTLHSFYRFYVLTTFKNVKNPKKMIENEQKKFKHINNQINKVRWMRFGSFNVRRYKMDFCFVLFWEECTTYTYILTYMKCQYCMLNITRSARAAVD